MRGILHRIRWAIPLNVLVEGWREILSTMSRLRLIVIASAACAAVVLAGCGNRASEAASVGDQSVSVSRVESLVRDAVNDDTVSAGWQGTPKELQRTVLSWEIAHLLVERAAADKGISATDGEVAHVKEGLASSGSLDQNLASIGVVPDQHDTFFRDLVLGAKIGYDTGAASAPRTLRIGEILTPNAKTAQSVLDKITADETSYQELAKQHDDGQVTLPQPLRVEEAQFAEVLGEDKLAQAKSGSGFTMPASEAGGGSGYVVIYVFDTRTESMAAMQPEAAAQAVFDAYSKARDSGAFTDGASVHLNPRYGTWNSDQTKIVDTPEPVVKRLAS